jgi:hypothetical protein
VLVAAAFNKSEPAELLETSPVDTLFKVACSEIAPVLVFLVITL